MKLPYMLNSLPQLSQRVMMMKALCWAMPERAQLMGAMIANGVDAVQWKRITDEMPQVRAVVPARSMYPGNSKPVDGRRRPAVPPAASSESLAASCYHLTTICGPLPTHLSQLIPRNMAKHMPYY